MDSLKQQIYKYIEKNNNNEKIISKSSIKTYTNYIYKLYKEFNNDNEFEAEFFLTNYKEVLKFIDNLINDNSKKSYIASILFLLKKFNDKNDIFKKNIYLEYIENTKKKIDDVKLNQEKNEKETENWITQDEIKIIYNDMYKKYYPLLQQYKNINIKKDYQNIQNFIIISLYYLNMPRRLLDYTELKISEYDKNKDNYIYKKQFIFNIFKTSKYYDNNKVDINNELYNILNLFILMKKNNNNLNQIYLLESDNHNKLNSVILNKRLNRIFNNRKISVNILRKSYLSNIYKNIPSLKEINNISNNMSNSFREQLISYVKK
jgi:hypothetical protein